MKILAINGSPRKGNTDTMLDLIPNVEIVKLISKKINFCGGGDNCCPKTKICEIKDDMAEIYSKLEEADVVILASPCYFSNVSGVMKVFMDRCNPYYYSKKLKDKKFFLLMVGGHEPSIKEGIKCMKNFLKCIYANCVGEYYTVADKKGEIKENQKVIKELKNIWDKLIEA